MDQITGCPLVFFFLSYPSSQILPAHRAMIGLPESPGIGACRRVRSFFIWVMAWYLLLLVSGAGEV
jgi:hypothetical protein